MTDKEAYNILLQAWQSNKEAKDYPSFDDINEALDTIATTLERKEHYKNKFDTTHKRSEQIKDNIRSFYNDLSFMGLLKNVDWDNTIKDMFNEITQEISNLIDALRFLKKFLCLEEKEGTYYLISLFHKVEIGPNAYNILKKGLE